MNIKRVVQETLWSCTCRIVLSPLLRLDGQGSGNSSGNGCFCLEPQGWPVFPPTSLSTPLGGGVYMESASISCRNQA